MIAREETQKHIDTVRTLLHVMIQELVRRATSHDRSKLESPEAEILEIYTPKLKGTTYGSDEYNQYLKEMKPALDHHYANNRHHPEYFENGVDGMNLLDLLEMFCDWKAATLRHADGDLTRSIVHNELRFKLSPQLEYYLFAFDV